MFEERWETGGVNFMRGKIGAIVRDPGVAAKLMPHDHPIGTKRICIDSGYYDTFNRGNVRLVDVRDTPIEVATETGLRTTAET